jgi:drug/metabolite transporter (DMT)-like permease
MTYEERTTWAQLLVAIVGTLAYVVIVLGKADGGPLVDVAYQSTMLWVIGLSIVASILLSIAFSIASGERSFRSDQRDKEIGAFGTRMGQAWMVIGAVAALLMALAEWDWFWIANAIYLGFALSAIFEGVAKVVAYRRGIPQW